MTDKIAAMLAPRALTTRELAEVLIPHLITYGTVKRGITHSGLWGIEDDAVLHSAEAALTSIICDAEVSVKSWLSDCQQDGEPRFYQAAGLTKAIARLCGAAAEIAMTLEWGSAPGPHDPERLEDWNNRLADRDGSAISELIAVADNG